MTLPVWLQHTGENVVGYACAAALAALTTQHVTTVAGLASAAGVGALTAVLTAGASLKAGNGTASFLPRVVAAPKGHGWNPVDPNPMG